MFRRSAHGIGNVEFARTFGLCTAIVISAAPALAQSESFANSTATGWRLGGVARLTAAGPTPIDAEGQGWLRLTPAEPVSTEAGRQGYAFYETPINPAVGLHVEFEYAIYGGSGGDGLTFFMFDGATPNSSFEIGASGGGLGYAPTVKLLGGTANQHGIDKGYLGIGFDSYGDFSNPTEGRTGGPGRVADAVVFRGPGDAFADYTYVTGTPSLPSGIRTVAGRPTGPTDPNYRHVTIDLTPAGNERYTVRVVLQQGQTRREVISTTLVPVPGWNAKPQNLKFGFAATTSFDGTDIHEIRLFTATPTVDHRLTKALQSVTGDTVVYTISVTNDGPGVDPAARIVDPGAPGLSDLSWVCGASAGATCSTAIGTGPLDSTASLPPGGTVTYTVQGRLTPLTTSPLVNTAAVTASSAVSDINPANNVASTPVTLSADLSISKSAATTYVPGEPFVYQIDVVNNSALWVFGARVSDVLPAGASGSWQCAVMTPPAICNVTRVRGALHDVVDLGPHGAVRYTLTLSVPPGQSGPLTDTASVALPATWIDPNPANNTFELTNQASPRADLTVSKTSSPKPYGLGESLFYTIVVSNVGPSNVAGAIVQDVFPASVTGVTWTCSGAAGGACAAAGTGDLDELVTLPAGGSVTFKVTGTAPPVLMQLQNTVTVAPPAGVSDPVPGNNVFTDSNPTRPPADLTVTKSASPNPYVPGQPLTYTVTVTNLGPANVTNARVQDALPRELTGTFNWTCAASGTGANCTPAGTGSLDTLVSLPSGASAVFTLTGPAPATPLDDLTNTATVTPPGDVTDLVPGNNTATSTTPAPFTANLQLQKSSTPSPYVPGAGITTTITVTNDGPNDVVNARVLDVPPPGLDAPTWVCTTTDGGHCAITSGSGLIDTFVSLPANGVATFVITATAPPVAGLPLVNTATVTPPLDVFDPNPADNSRTNANSPIPGPDLAITKQASVSQYVSGQSLTYTLTATNNGPVAAENARVQDALQPFLSGFTWTCSGTSGGATCGRASGTGPIDVIVTLPGTGASVQLVITGIVPAGVRGPIVNTSSVSVPAGVLDPTPGNDTATVTLESLPQPDLEITKGAVPVVTYGPGQPLTYLLAIRNIGDASMPAAGYSVQDPLPAQLAGATWTCNVLPSGNCEVTGNALTTTDLPALAPGAQLSIALQTVVPANVVDTLANTAQVAIAPGFSDRSLANNTSSVSLFAAPITSSAIIGVVTDSDGAPLAGITMELSGAASLVTLTASDGTYGFPGLPPGHDYTVAPAATVGYVFSPPSRTFPLLSGQARADFVGLVEPYTRYYSEGATGPFFSTTFSLTNPGTVAAQVSLRFQRPDEPEVTHALVLEPRQHVVFDPATQPGLESTAFSTIVDANRQIISARTMVWDRSGYGTHRGMGIGTPRTSWYIAEGATLPRFSLFYLVQNPGDTTATVTIRYLLQAHVDTPVERTYVVAPRSRYTIAVHDDPALVNQELSAEIIADVPIVVERSMYRSDPRLFEAGAAVTAAPATSASWFFAEGATGSYFDMFLLLANPGLTSLTATVEYLLPDGGVIVRQHEIPAGARRTLWVDYEAPELADTAVSIVVTASGPIVAERAMWWPGTDGTWTGGHASLGTTYVAPRWGISGLEAGGATNTEPWILVANPGATATTIRMTLLFLDGREPVIADYPVAAHGRLTIAVGQWHPETADASFGAIVEQLGEPTGIVVESAVYSDSDGVKWAAGRGGLASPIP